MTTDSLLNTFPSLAQTLSAAFTAGAVRGYLPAIQRLAEEACAKWTKTRSVDGVEAVSETWKEAHTVRS